MCVEPWPVCEPRWRGKPRRKREAAGTIAPHRPTLPICVDYSYALLNHRGPQSAWQNLRASLPSCAIFVASMTSLHSCSARRSELRPIASVLRASIHRETKNHLLPDTDGALCRLPCRRRCCLALSCQDKRRQSCFGDERLTWASALFTMAGGSVPVVKGGCDFPFNGPEIAPVCRPKNLSGL